MSRKLTNRDWADLVRSCGLRLEYDGEVHAMPLIFALVKLEPLYGVQNPVKVDGDHLVMMLYLGADWLESRPR